MSNKGTRSGRRRRVLLVGRYPCVPEGQIYMEVFVEFGFNKVPAEEAADLEVALDKLEAQLPENPFQLGLGL